jgi:DNA-binding response OmpR family regulator
VRTGQRVLVVDGLSETGEVLKAVLEPRGLVVDRIRGHRRAGAGAAPQIVVIDRDDGTADDAHDRRWADVPRVVIGSADMPDGWDPRQAGAAGQHYLQKPFEYGELVSAIEHLLEKPLGSARGEPPTRELADAA